jgi:hypothetical protein
VNCDIAHRKEDGDGEIGCRRVRPSEMRTRLRKVVLIEFHNSDEAAGTTDDRTLRHASNASIMTRYPFVKVGMSVVSGIS